MYIRDLLLLTSVNQVSVTVLKNEQASVLCKVLQYHDETTSDVILHSLRSEVNGI